MSLQRVVLHKAIYKVHATRLIATNVTATKVTYYWLKGLFTVEGLFTVDWHSYVSVAQLQRVHIYSCLNAWGTGSQALVWRRINSITLRLSDCVASPYLSLHLQRKDNQLRLFCCHFVNHFMLSTYSWCYCCYYLPAQTRQLWARHTLNCD